MRSVIDAALLRLGMKVISAATWSRSQREQQRRDLVDASHVDLFSMLLELEFGAESPFFVQVGANDGVRDDRLSRFVKRFQWPGILVEPQPDTFKKLCENYSDHPQVMFENCAVGRGSGPLTLYRLRDPQGRGGCSDLVTTFDRTQLLKARDRFGWDFPIETLRVPKIELTDMLVNRGVDQLDLLVVDAEGMDFEVLRSLDYSRFSPRLIQFEHIHLSEIDFECCLEFLRERHFRFALCGRDVLAHRAGPRLSREPASAAVGVGGRCDPEHSPKRPWAGECDGPFSDSLTSQ